MLQLRPSCEHCDTTLPPDSTQAMICSYECTFCHDCVEQVLNNVCPNCGGGFCRRPVRPRTAWRTGVSLQHQPASEEVKHRPLDVAAHRAFAANIAGIPPPQR
jgi:hypothetical protein